MNLAEYALILAAALFAIGLVGVIARRNLLFMLISIEIMLNSAGLAFVAASARLGDPDGQAMVLFMLTMAAAELAVGLVIVQRVQVAFRTLDTGSIRTMEG